jgi:DNA-binding ferritin-like protein (Dps family)
VAESKRTGRKPTRRTKSRTKNLVETKQAKRLKQRKDFKQQLIRIVYGPHPDDVAEMCGATAELRAELALRQDVLFDWAQGKGTAEIANERYLKEDLVKRLLADATAALYERYSQADPRDNFAFYAAFHLGLIRKLDQLYDEFTEDKENRQYSAAVNALKTQSEIFDKILAQGVKVGVIQDKKVEDVNAKDPDKLIDQLLKEQHTMTLIIEELQVTRERQRRVIVSKGGRQAIGQHSSDKANGSGDKVIEHTEGSPGDGGDEGQVAESVPEYDGFTVAPSRPETSKVIRPKPVSMRKRVTFGELGKQIGNYGGDE